MNPRMCIIVNYRSEHGGLHDHVADQVGFATEFGCDVTLVCPPGPFAERMRDRCDVIAMPLGDPGNVAAKVLEQSPPAIVHAHPGAAREVAFAIKEARPVPVLVTYHGSRPETLTAADPRVDIAITVSEVTRRFVIKRTTVDPARIVVIPNAVNTSVFAPAASLSQERRSVLVASRWDDDKGFVVELVLEAMRGVLEAPDLADVDVVVAGDGSRLQELQQVCGEANAVRERQSFRSVGWLDAPALAQEIASASVVVSPGRGALQSMAVGRATVALGSKGYIGFLEGVNLLQGADANFGSGGLGPRKYPQGLVVQDLRRALDRSQDTRLLEAYQAVVQERTLPMIGQAHARVWSIALAGMES